MKILILILVFLIPAFADSFAGATRMSEPGRKFIQRFEGYRSRAYKDAAGVWTIGWGHTATARPGMVITKRQAIVLFIRDVTPRERYVERKAIRGLRQHEFDALVSFVYNLGYRLRGGLLTGIRTMDTGLVVYKLKLYVKAGGRVLRGLVRRRNAEAEIYSGVNLRKYGYGVMPCLTIR